MRQRACQFLTNLDRVLSSIISDKTGCLTFTEESARWIKKLIYDRNGSHLVEEFFPVLVSKRPNLYKEVYDGCLKGKLAALAAHPSANFVVQKLIQRMPLPPDGMHRLHDSFSSLADVQQGKWSTIEELAEELAPSFERYLSIPVLEAITNAFLQTEQLVSFSLLSLQHPRSLLDQASYLKFKRPSGTDSYTPSKQRQEKTLIQQRK